jgi:hypothetical protein
MMYGSHYNIFIPPAMKLWGGGGVYWNRVVCLSVHPSVCRRNGFRALEHYPYHLESPYHTYGLPIGGGCFLLILRSKGQRSSALDIKVEIRFPGSKQLSLPPRVTISHIFHICTYFKLKEYFGFEKYLEKLKNFDFRRSICKLRISAHKLMIEVGRYSGITWSERICNKCNSGLLGDEIHFFY